MLRVQHLHERPGLHQFSLDVVNFIGKRREVNSIIRISSLSQQIRNHPLLFLKQVDRIG